MRRIWFTYRYFLLDSSLFSCFTRHLRKFKSDLKTSYRSGTGLKRPKAQRVCGTRFSHAQKTKLSKLKMNPYFFHEKHCNAPVKISDEGQKRTLFPLILTSHLSTGTEYLSPLCEG